MTDTSFPALYPYMYSTAQVELAIFKIFADMMLCS